MSKKRLEKEAKDTKWFDSVTMHSPNDLDKQFIKLFGPILKLKRGAGYWIWKLNIILKKLKEMDKNDILIYLDAGCKINIEGKERFDEYIQMLSRSDKGILSFQMSHPEKVFTIKEIFKYFNVESDKKITETGQMIGGIRIMMKNKHLMQLMSTQYNALYTNPLLFTDYYNKSQDSYFKDNRHDQSIFSVACKIYGSIVLPDETYFKSYGNAKSRKYPFWATRIISQDTKDKSESNDKYVLFIPQGGFNDCLCSIYRTILYCKHFKRTLLLDMTNSYYRINFSDYFDIENVGIEIINDSCKIQSILNKSNISIYPKVLQMNLKNILKNKIKLSYGKYYYSTEDDVPLMLPSVNVPEDIIFHSKCGGGNGYQLFQHLTFKEHIKKICNDKIKSLGKNYICFHFRYTDKKCEFRKMYEQYKETIQKFQTIYVATDDKNIVKFLNQNIQMLNVLPPSLKRIIIIFIQVTLSPQYKIKDMLVDLMIATHCDTFVSNSKGGFINLIHQCRKHKTNVLEKILKNLIIFFLQNPVSR